MQNTGEEVTEFLPYMNIYMSTYVDAHIEHRMYACILVFGYSCDGPNSNICGAKPRGK